MTEETESRVEIDVASLPIKSVNGTVARDGEHVLSSAVEVFSEYEQRYDPEQEAILIGPSSIEDKSRPYTQYDCSCGESFVDQNEALEHLVSVGSKSKSEKARDDPDQTEL